MATRLPHHRHNNNNNTQTNNSNNNETADSDPGLSSPSKTLKQAKLEQQGCSASKSGRWTGMVLLLLGCILLSLNATSTTMVQNAIAEVWQQQPTTSERKRNKKVFRHGTDDSPEAPFVKLARPQEQRSSPSLASPATPSSPSKYYIPELDGPPSDLVLQGQRDYYTPCPRQYKKRVFLLAQVDTQRVLNGTFASLGYQVHSAKTKKQIQTKFRSGTHFITYRIGGLVGEFEVGKPYQRYARIPGMTKELDSKDGFAKGFQNFQRRQEQTQPQSIFRNNNQNKKNYIYFLPETYRLSIPSEAKAFTKRLEQGNGRQRPWVFKQTKMSRSRGVEMLGPNSPALENAVARAQNDSTNSYIIQSYVCNELTWFQQQKFDLRFYWFVASVDPLIVLFHDGLVRVGGSQYNETDFASTKQHLTYHNSDGTTQQHVAEGDVSASALWRRVEEHYQQNEDRLSQVIVGTDPVRHVRNQIKEAISTTVEAFYDSVFSLQNYNVSTENLFSLYGADIIIDDDLDIFYLEAQSGPQLKDSDEYRLDLYQHMLPAMIHTVEEIADKQVADAKANLWPLQNLGEWEIVYAGKDQWRYEYSDYERSTNKKGCSM